MDLLAELKWRGLLFAATEGAAELLSRKSVTAYIGFDPTAPSLHVGSLLQIVALARLQRAGHAPIALAGGGTGMIGDPSGKSAERKLLTRDALEANLRGMQSQLERFLDFTPGRTAARLMNNADWLSPLTMMDFLRDVGKHFSVNYMVSKESVRRRLEQEEGISFTEFSYMLLQAYDFLVLNERFGCELQMGGSDQWGNITAGTDLIRKVTGRAAHGVVLPLITTASGAKFGKTEAGTVWLDAKLTSPYRFYQFWLNADDRDVMNHVRYFTWITHDDATDLAAEQAAAPEKRAAQRLLAREMTALVHGAGELERAERAAALLFGGDLAGATASELEEVFGDVPSHSVPRAAAIGLGVVELAVQAGLASSKGEARRLVQSGGLYVNHRRVVDAAEKIGPAEVVAGGFVVLRKGAREYRLVRLIEA
ncbi:MAG: tyrosine--tRNA ligase [Phycisphaerae bacterium]